MKYIKQYNDLNNPILEKMGVVESTLFYVEPLTNEAYSNIIEFVDDNKINRIDDESFTGIESTYNVTLDFRYLKKYITDLNLYTHFPVSEILLTMDLHHVPTKNQLQNNSSMADPFRLGGSASPFAKGREIHAARFNDPVISKTDHSIKLHLTISFYFTYIFQKNLHRDKLYAAIESTILHELNHCYEYYMRKWYGVNEIPLSLTHTSAFAKNTGRKPLKIWNHWENKFLYYIYLAEPHEVRATVQEAKTYVDRLSLNGLKKTGLWQKVLWMKNFSAEKYIKDFNRVITNHNPDYKDAMISSLIKDFLNNYEYLSSEWKEKPLFNIDMMKKLSNEDFIDLWAKQIRKSGEILYRKILKLYAYKRDNEEEYYEDYEE